MAERLKIKRTKFMDEVGSSICGEIVEPTTYYNVKQSLSMEICFKTNNAINCLLEDWFSDYDLQIIMVQQTHDTH